MSDFDITLDVLEQVVGELQDLTDAWSQVIPVVREAVDSNFDAQGTPVFGAWEPSRRALRTGTLTLVDLGNLRANACNVVLAGPDSLVIGTDVPYAADLTRGMPWMPERPMIQIGEGTVEDSARALLRGIFRG